MPRTINIVDVIIKEVSISKDGEGKYVISVVYFLLTDMDSIVVGPAVRRMVLETDILPGQKQHLITVFSDMKNKIKELEEI